VKTVFRVKCLNNGHARQGLLQNRDQPAQLLLAFASGVLQTLRYAADDVSAQRQEQNGEQGQFPAQVEQCAQRDQNGDRCFEEDFNGADDAELNLHQVVGHAADGIAFARIRIPSHGQFQHLDVHRVSQITADTRSDRRQGEQRRVPHSILQNGNTNNAQADVKQRCFSTYRLNKGVELSAQPLDSGGIRRQLLRHISGRPTE